MPRTCSLCLRNDSELAELYRKKTPYRRIAERYKVGLGTVQRHAEHVYRDTCLAQLPVPTQPPADLAKAGSRSYLSDMDALHAKAMYWLNVAEEQGSAPAAAVWIKELRGILESSHKMYTAQKQIEREAAKDGISNSTELDRSPEWLSLRMAICTALLPFPEARAAVLAAIRAKRGDQTILEDRVSPAVQRLIDETMSTDPPEAREDRRPPPAALDAPDNAPRGERRTVQRIWYRCLTPTSWKGMNWIPGQIIDGSRPEIYPPPMNGAWEPFSRRTEVPGAPASGGLKGTKP